MLTTSKPQELIRIFQEGGIFAYPTEAVYGLGCNPDKKMSVLRLLYIKNRPVNKGLILVASDFSQVEKYLKPLTNSQKKYTKSSDTTYLYPALNSAPKWLTGGFDSLAIRISKHPLVRELCSTLNSALVSTSANLSGQEAARTATEVNLHFGEKINAILEGETGGLSNPTAIHDSITGEIIRP